MSLKDLAHTAWVARKAGKSSNSDPDVSTVPVLLRMLIGTTCMCGMCFSDLDCTLLDVIHGTFAG